MGNSGRGRPKPTLLCFCFRAAGDIEEPAAAAKSTPHLAAANTNSSFTTTSASVSPEDSLNAFTEAGSAPPSPTIGAAAAPTTLAASGARVSPHPQ